MTKYDGAQHFEEMSFNHHPGDVGDARVAGFPSSDPGTYCLVMLVTGTTRLVRVPSDAIRRIHAALGAWLGAVAHPDVDADPDDWTPVVFGDDPGADWSPIVPTFNVGDRVRTRPNLFYNLDRRRIPLPGAAGKLATVNGPPNAAGYIPVVMDGQPENVFYISPECLETVDNQDHGSQTDDGPYAKGGRLVSINGSRVFVKESDRIVIDPHDAYLEQSVRDGNGPWGPGGNYYVDNSEAGWLIANAYREVVGYDPDDFHPL